MKFDTLAIHAGAQPDKTTGSIAPPIHLSTNFLHGAASEESFGYMYIRDKNPTQDRLEEAMNALEGGEGALAFSSGMGATAAMLQSLPAGSHILIPRDVYSHVRVLASRYLANWQIDETTVDMRSPRDVERAIRPTTKLIWWKPRPIRRWTSSISERFQTSRAARAHCCLSTIPLRRRCCSGR